MVKLKPQEKKKVRGAAVADVKLENVNDWKREAKVRKAWQTTITKPGPTRPANSYLHII